MYSTSASTGNTWMLSGPGPGSGLTVTDGGSYTFVQQTPAGTSVKIDNNPKADGISPRLMFKFVKSKFKMNPTQEEWHRARLKKLGKLISNAKELNQISMFEHLSEIMAVAARESELRSYFKDGVQFISREDLLKFQPKIAGKCVFFKKIEEFPRPIPHIVSSRIKKLQDDKVFDEIWILYLDYTKEELKSNSRKVREKDPIAFGCFKYNPNVLYFITEWIDDQCDLTIDKVVETLKEGNKEFDLGSLPEIDEAYVQAIKDEVLKRHERLAATNSSTWREKEVEAKVAEEKKKWEQEMMTKMKIDPEFTEKPGLISRVKKLFKK
jgi:hypothetical protein